MAEEADDERDRTASFQVMMPGGGTINFPSAKKFKKKKKRRKSEGKSDSSIPSTSKGGGAKSEGKRRARSTIDPVTGRRIYIKPDYESENPNMAEDFASMVASVQNEGTKGDGKGGRYAAAMPKRKVLQGSGKKKLVDKNKGDHYSDSSETSESDDDEDEEEEEESEEESSSSEEEEEEEEEE